MIYARGYATPGLLLFIISTRLEIVDCNQILLLQMIIAYFKIKMSKISLEVDNLSQIVYLCKYLSMKVDICYR